MGITIVWFELEAGTVERVAAEPARVELLHRAWSDHLDDAGDPRPPVRRVERHDWKARVIAADDERDEVGDLVADAIQGDRPLALGDWPDGYLRAYSRAHLDRLLREIPDDPAHQAYDLRVRFAEVIAAGSELVSLWT